MTHQSEQTTSTLERATRVTAGMVLIAVVFFAFQGCGSSQPNDVSSTDDLRLQHQPRVGPADAPIKVVEFADFSCPHCATFEREVFQPLMDQYVETGQVAFYFINYPFLGADSLKAGQAAEAVYAQDPDAFWAYYQALYESEYPKDKGWATSDDLVQIAQRAAPNIDHNALAEALNQDEYLDEVQRDKQIAEHAGVQGTPTVFVNGEVVENWSYDHLTSVIESTWKELAD